jgi:uncharacterized membrane protein
MDGEDDSRLVPFMVCYSHAEAMVVRSMLEANGIFVHAADWFTISAAPYLMTACGGIKLWVPVGDVEAAIHLVRDETEVSGERPPPAFSRNVFVNLVIGLFLFVFGAGAPPPRLRGEVLPRR